MSVLYKFKPWKDRVLEPLLSALGSIGISPNMITISGLMVSLSAAVLAAFGHIHAGLALFVLGATLDCLDGSLARFSGRSTEFGRFLDGICDRISEGAFIVGAVLGGAPLPALMIGIGSVAQLVVRTALHYRGRSTNSAWFSRPERLAFIAVGLLLPHSYGSLVLLIGGVLCMMCLPSLLLSTDRGQADPAFARVNETYNSMFRTEPAIKAEND